MNDELALQALRDASSTQSAERSLPANLSLHATGQYCYVYSTTKRRHYFGTDRQRAIAAANKLNALLLPNNPLVDKVLRKEHKLSECVTLFRDEVLPERSFKPKTENEYKIHLRRIEADLERRPVEQLTVKDCAQYLREVPPLFGYGNASDRCSSACWTAPYRKAGLTTTRLRPPASPRPSANGNG